MEFLLAYHLEKSHERFDSFRPVTREAEKEGLDMPLKLRRGCAIAEQSYDKNDCRYRYQKGVYCVLVI